MEILIPIAFFAMVAAIFIVPRYFKSREREALQATVRAAIERGQSLSPESLDAITRDLHVAAPAPSAVRDLRTAVVWIAVALGFAIFGWFVDDGDHWYGFIAFACIPGLVGLVYLAMAAINAGVSKKNRA
jgi:hypothetical protein